MTSNVGAACTGVGLDVPELSVEPHDTDGRLLRLQTQPTSHVAVADRLLRIDGLSLHLEILSASHRVVVRAEDGSSIHETVACAAGSAVVVDDDCLPDRHRWTTRGWQVDFSSSLRFGPDAVEKSAAEFGRLRTERPDANLVGRFPGHDLALTALNADLTRADQLAWRSWHLYPGTDPHVVTTVTRATRLERRP